ncbi:MAG: HzsA-related protein, partial [Planctomycetota bacterium]
VSRNANHRDPWAFSERAFMAAHGKQIVLMDDTGRTEVIHEVSAEEAAAGLECHEPRPVMQRQRERVIPPKVDRRRETGTLILVDVYKGRNMRGVERGEIKKLLVMESLPKPINFTGGMDPLTYGGSFTLERVLGTVPVEPDGSACMEVPAMRSLFLIALDENDMSVKRMQSFLTVQPGEATSCVGCHEQRTQTFLPNRDLAALKRRPSRIEPVEDCPICRGHTGVFDFPRDVQPILDRLCVDCHGYEKTERGGPYAGNVVLSGDRGPMFSHAYFTMTVRQLFVDGRDLAKSNYPPRTLGSGGSRILKMLDGSHYDVKATEHQKRMLRLWIEVGAPYPGTYAALGCGSIGGYQQNNLVNTDFDWPTTRSAAEVIQRRCASCHQGNDVLPSSMSDERGISFWRFDVNDPRLKLSRHVVFNLSRPEKSLLLLAPLAEQSGGFALCRDEQDRPVAAFADSSDPDYRKLLAMVTAGKENLDAIKRFDMPDFRPRPQYVREMKRYGVLPADHPDDALLDVYQLDRKYWQSLWYRAMALE